MYTKANSDEWFEKDGDDPNAIRDPEGFSDEELDEAFKAVADPEDWKAPIFYHIDDLPFSEELITEAIITWTGSVPIFYSYPGGRVVEAAGYRAVVGF